MDFSDAQTAFLAHQINELIQATNKGKNEALRQKDHALARAYLCQNQGVRELAAAIFDDETITDPEQCPLLIL